MLGKRVADLYCIVSWVDNRTGLGQKYPGSKLGRANMATIGSYILEVFRSHALASVVIKKTPWLESASELYRPSEVNANFCG
jgi:hypothetical protein